MSRFLLLMAAGAILLGAQTPLGGPSLGYIFDERGQTLRPILGIPGASLFGDPWATTGRISIAAVSAQQNVAIVNDGVWKAIGLAGGSVTALPDGLPSRAQLSVSENGTAAAFYDADKNALSVVTGIAGSSMAANSVSLAALPGAITVFAAADDGSLLLSASVPAGGEALFWIGADGSVYQLASLNATASINSPIRAQMRWWWIGPPIRSLPSRIRERPRPSRWSHRMQMEFPVPPARRSVRAAQSSGLPTPARARCWEST